MGTPSGVPRGVPSTLTFNFFKRMNNMTAYMVILLYIIIIKKEQERENGYPG
jgi:hypothetical protein